jgi:hypothetical protein
LADDAGGDRRLVEVDDDERVDGGELDGVHGARLPLSDEAL